MGGLRRALEAQEGRSAALEQELAGRPSAAELDKLRQQVGLPATVNACRDMLVQAVATKVATLECHAVADSLLRTCFIISLMLALHASYKDIRHSSDVLSPTLDL